MTMTVLELYPDYDSRVQQQIPAISGNFSHIEPLLVSAVLEMGEYVSYLANGDSSKAYHNAMGVILRNCSYANHVLKKHNLNVWDKAESIAKKDNQSMQYTLMINTLRLSAYIRPGVDGTGIVDYPIVCNLIAENVVAIRNMLMEEGISLASIQEDSLPECTDKHPLKELVEHPDGIKVRNIGHLPENVKGKVLAFVRGAAEYTFGYTDQEVEDNIAKFRSQGYHVQTRAFDAPDLAFQVSKALPRD